MITAPVAQAASLSHVYQMLLACLLSSLALPQLVFAEDAKPKLAIHVGKVLTCVGEPIIGGTILVSEGKI